MIGQFDIEYKRNRLNWNADRNRIKLVGLRVIEDFIHLTNDMSDGWAYWPKPGLAAKKLSELIENQYDVTEKDLKKSLVPIKSCITRHKEAFGRSLLLQPFLDLLAGL